MSHTAKDKAKITARVRRLRGQMEAIEGAIGTAPCGEILNLVASVRGALNGLMAELIEDHIREHVMDARSTSDRNEGARELIDVVKAYLR
jgi:FrmR/RcnR family transcriptional regulator, repressor of frmRAB operon